ncbi:MAG: DUF1918 domain-containing protein [Ilumatobacteraceae bacterium]
MTNTRPGDRIVIHGHPAGKPDRTGEILEVRGAQGDPPYVVSWDDSGHTTLFYPGTDCTVQHLTVAGTPT